MNSKTSFRSRKDKKPKKGSSYRAPEVIREKKIHPVILRDPEATRKLCEVILESPNGKRALSRLARTCRALSQPALNVLWKDLDSLIPIIGLFPSHILKKTRKPAQGLAQAPQDEDWHSVFKYSEHVRSIVFNESAGSYANSFLQYLKEGRPRTYILPNLHELTWKIETAAALDHCSLFLNPGLQAINLEVGTKIPHLSAFLTDMSSRTKLTRFSFISSIALPDAFTELLLRQDALEKLILAAPGALSPGIGRWIASLPVLKHLQLDLTGRSIISVEGFFDELRPRSGDSTPSSVGSTDSGVFSGEELDFSEIRKSALRLTGDLPSKGSFTLLRKLHLTGDVSNIAVFVKHLPSPLSQMDLVIEDPPDNADWQDLSGLICDRFSETLQSLRISATGSSKFVDLVRSTSRAEPANGRLSLEHLTSLPALARLDIDLPESVVFTTGDIKSLAENCPNLETLRLCPLARFPQTGGPPKIALEDLAVLLKSCKNLQTLAIVFYAKEGSEKILATRSASSLSLLRLHVGHSWIADPLQVSILLSHLAPRLESLKWFQEKNRPGYIEANAKNWQTMLDILPYLQQIRATERSFAQAPLPTQPETAEKAISAIVEMVDRAIFVRPQTQSNGVQCRPTLVDRMVNATTNITSVSVDARPMTRQFAVDARPLTISTGVDASILNVSKSVEALLSPTVNHDRSPTRRLYSNQLILPTLFSLFSFIYKVFISYPLSAPSRILQLALALKPNWQVKKQTETTESVQSDPNTLSSNGTTLIPMDTLQVRQ